MTNSVFKQAVTIPGSPVPSEAGPAGTGETVTSAGSAMEVAKALKQEMVTSSQKVALDKLAGLTSLDWKNIPPPMLAQMLIQIPFKGSGTDPDYYLQPFQAMIFAMRCFELGLSPFSNEVWFNPKNNKVNVTLEGKLKLLKIQGITLGAPFTKRIPEDPKQPLVAYYCSIDTGNGKVEYTAYLKDWQQSRSPVWKERPDHMLYLRAIEKCLSFATGFGVSELMGDKDLQTGPEVAEVIPEITVTEMK